MEYKEVKTLIDDNLEPMKADISEIKEMTKLIPILAERLVSYKDIEKKVSDHEMLLCGTKGRNGLVDDVLQLKNQGKKIFNLAVKVFAFTGTILGIIAVLKGFNVF